MNVHRAAGLAVLLGAMAVATMPSHAGPLADHGVDGTCGFRISSSATGSANRLQMNVFGAALPTVQPGVVTSTIRCEVYDRAGRVIYDRMQSAVGVAVLSDTVETANSGPFVVCATAQAAWSTGEVVTDPRYCVS